MLSRLIPLNISLALFVVMFTSGCRSAVHDIDLCASADSCPPVTAPTCGPAQLEMDDPCTTCCPDDNSFGPEAPHDFTQGESPVYLDMTLDQAIVTAIQNSRVIRELGGAILQRPTESSTVLDPALQYTDPISGEEAALSAFDASIGSHAFFEKNDRVFNDRFLGTDGFVQQDLADLEFGINKRAATGTQMSLKNITDYDFNNSIGNRFGSPSSSWTTHIDAEVRQPLLQGAGVLFNRTAGPGSRPGFVNGILVSRVRTDINLVEFEIAVRELVSNVENTYWDLYFAYRDLNAKREARDQALESWRKAEAQSNQSIRRDEVGQAREQYWRFESAVLDALHGKLLDATRTYNGSPAGTFRNPGGVRVAERRLRLVLGMPINSAELIRPADEPTVAPLQFDWDLCAEEALSLRPELRRQQWVIKQRELELLANKNYLMPQLDAIARYRWRGFGHDLVSQSHAQFSSAWGDLADSDFQEWQLGIEYAMPLGFRHAHAAVRNSELQLARERAVLAEQRRQVIYGLSNAFGELRRAFSVVRAEYNRREAANDQLNSVQAAFAGGFAPFDLVLEAQRRVVDTEIQYHQAKVEYALAVKNIHFEKGSILEYANVSLAEGPSVPEAYADAARRAARRGRVLDYVCRDAVISQGATRRSAIADVGPTVIKSGIYEPMSIPRTDIPPAESLEPVDAPHRD